jgi:hypothetical protein
MRKNFAASWVLNTQDAAKKALARSSEIYLGMLSNGFLK